jgi:predicted nicotinamide N-methyase
MNEERRVLYALVAAGFAVVVAVLAVAALVYEIGPAWWSWATLGLTASLAVVGALRWRRTGFVLGCSVGLFVVWTIGVLALR